MPEVLTRRLVRHVADEPRARPVRPCRLDPRGARARRSSSASRSRRRSGPSRARAGSSPWWARRASARRRPSPSSRPTSSWPTACGSGWSRSTPTGSRRSSSSRPMPRSSTCRWPWSTIPAEMPRALDELGAVDLVFIDTAGRSPRDEVKIRELAEFLLQARPDEVHLVLSAVAGQRSLRAAVERFADGPGRPPDPDQARRGRQPGRRPRGARPFEPPGELPDHRPGRPRRHRAGRPQAAGAADPQTGGPVR